MGPGVGSLEVERKERKYWKEKHRFSPDVNRDVLCWGQRQSATRPGLESRGGKEGVGSEGAHRWLWFRSADTQSLGVEGI